MCYVLITMIFVFLFFCHYIDYLCVSCVIVVMCAHDSFCFLSVCMIVRLSVHLFVFYVSVYICLCVVSLPPCPTPHQSPRR